MQAATKAAAPPAAAAGRAPAGQAPAEDVSEELPDDGDSTWARREQARMRQIMIGKARPEYRRYLGEVPLDTRGPSEPSTPDPRARVSKRQFDRALGEWRRRLHEFDGSPGEPRRLPGGGHEALPGNATTPKSTPTPRRRSAVDKALAAARALDAPDGPAGGAAESRGGDAGAQEGGVVRLRLADRLPGAGATASAPRQPDAQAAARASQDPATPARPETRRNCWGTPAPGAYWEGIVGTAEKASPPPSFAKANAPTLHLKHFVGGLGAEMVATEEAVAAAAEADRKAAAAPVLVAALAAVADTPEKDLVHAWRCSPGADVGIQDASSHAAAGRPLQCRGPSPGSRGGSPRRRCQSPRTPPRPGSHTAAASTSWPAATPERHPFLVTETPSPKQHYHHHFAQMPRGTAALPPPLRADAERHHHFAASYQQAYNEYTGEYEVSARTATTSTAAYNEYSHNEYEVSTSHVVPWNAAAAFDGGGGGVYYAAAAYAAAAEVYR